MQEQPPDRQDICLAGLSAIFLAVALSVLFAVACASEDIGEAGVSEGDFLIIWKPAYLFSVPAEGDLVLFRPEESFFPAKILSGLQFIRNPRWIWIR